MGISSCTSVFFWLLIQTFSSRDAYVSLFDSEKESKNYKIDPLKREEGNLQKVREGLTLSPLPVWERREMETILLTLMAVFLPLTTRPPPPLSLADTRHGGIQGFM